jgi:hypothetical protein
LHRKFSFIAFCAPGPCKTTLVGGILEQMHHSGHRWWGRRGKWGRRGCFPLGQPFGMPTLRSTFLFGQGSCGRAVQPSFYGKLLRPFFTPFRIGWFAPTAPCFQYGRERGFSRRAKPGLISSRTSPTGRPPLGGEKSLLRVEPFGELAAFGSCKQEGQCARRW